LRLKKYVIIVGILTIKRNALQDEGRFKLINFLL